MSTCVCGYKLYDSLNCRCPKCSKPVKDYEDEYITAKIAEEDAAQERADNGQFGVGA